MVCRLTVYKKGTLLSRALRKMRCQVARHSEVTAKFGEKLRKLRKERGVSQEELAARAGLHRTYVSSVERGERNVSLETIDKLARALGLPMGDLMP